MKSLICISYQLEAKASSSYSQKIFRNYLQSLDLVNSGDSSYIKRLSTASQDSTRANDKNSPSHH